MFKNILKPLFLLVALSLSSCDILPPVDPDDHYEINITNYQILEDTPYETTVYKMKSSEEGPKCAIVGGIHGDEIAGWKAALNFLSKDYFKGEILLIPQANILADVLKERYAGANHDVKDGYITDSQYNTLKANEIFKDRDVDHIKDRKYYDLNRRFPGKMGSNDTQLIAYEVFNTVIDFEPDYVVDLHESQHDHGEEHSSGSNYLGNTIIYGNDKSIPMSIYITETFDEEYLLNGEDIFEYIEGNVSGSFCNVMGHTLTDAKVITIETNRDRRNGVDRANLNRRIEQQEQLIHLFLDYAYSEYVQN